MRAFVFAATLWGVMLAPVIASAQQEPQNSVAPPPTTGGAPEPGAPGAAPSPGVAPPSPSSPPAAAPTPGAPGSDAEMIANARQGAPHGIAQNASVVALANDGSFRTLTNGTNSFTCIAGNPATALRQPLCADANGLEWVKAWLTHGAPASSAGLIYVMTPSSASNSDPYATVATTDNHWFAVGPHVKIVGTPTLMATYPRLPQPETTAPFVMWPGTVYEHLVVPMQ